MGNGRRQTRQVGQGRKGGRTRTGRTGRDRDNLGSGRQALDRFPVPNGCKTMSYPRILTEQSLTFILCDTLPDRPFGDKHLHLTTLQGALLLLRLRRRLLLRLPLPLRLPLLRRHPPRLKATPLRLPGALSARHQPRSLVTPERLGLKGGRTAMASVVGLEEGWSAIGSGGKREGTHQYITR